MRVGRLLGAGLEPDFYLASSEGYDLENPRRCFAIRRLRTHQRDDLLLVRIDPPLAGQKYGLGDRDVDHVVLAPRHRGQSLSPIRRWPLFCHVARLLTEFEGRDVIRADEVELIAWAAIYETEEAAFSKSM